MHKAYSLQRISCRFRNWVVDGYLPVVLIAALHLSLIRRAGAEDRVDLKTLFYAEDGQRMQVFSPSIMVEKQFGIPWTIKLEGIYNAISGATPTGAPAELTPTAAPTIQTTATPRPTPTTSGGGGSSRPAPVYTPPAPKPLPTLDDDREDEDEKDEEDEEDDERDDDRRSLTPSKWLSQSALPRPKARYAARAGATPAPTPAPKPAPAPAPAPAPKPAPTSKPAPKPKPAPVVQPTTAAPAPVAESTDTAKDAGKNAKVPKTEVEDERWGFNIDVARKVGRHTVGGQLSYSTESDYQSIGLSLRDGIDFNQRNTTLLLGAAYTHDLINAVTMESEETKDSIDFMIGLSQTLDIHTLFTINLSAGHVSGFLADPYKVVELNGILVPEVRPGTKDKYILYTALTRRIAFMNASAEFSYRLYNDSYGVSANTFGLAWYQKLGPHWTVRPAARYYTQSAADFYDIRFAGEPEYYSSDYRLSSFNAIGYGLKLIWQPTRSLAFDAAIERYEQTGNDGFTPGDAYPSASLIIAGIRINL